MSAASVEQPADGERPLIAEANHLMERIPDYRFEIIGGMILDTGQSKRTP